MRILKLLIVFTMVITIVIPSLISPNHVFADELEEQPVPPVEQPTPPVEQPVPPVEQPTPPVEQPTPPPRPNPTPTPTPNPPPVEEVTPPVEEIAPPVEEVEELPEEVIEEVVKDYTTCEITIDGNDFVYKGKKEETFTTTNRVCASLNMVGKYVGGERKGTFSLTSKAYNGEVFDGQYISYETDTDIISIKVNTIMPEITTPLLEDFETTKTLIYRKIVKDKYNVVDLQKFLNDGRFDYIVKDGKYYGVIDGKVVQEVTKGQLVHLGLIQSEILRLERLQAERLEYERKIKKEEEEKAIALAEQKRQDRLKEIEEEKKRQNSVDYSKVKYIILLPTIALVVLLLLFIYTLIKSKRISTKYRLLDNIVDSEGNVLALNNISYDISNIIKKDKQLAKIYNKSKRLKK